MELELALVFLLSVVFGHYAKFLGEDYVLCVCARARALYFLSEKQGIVRRQGR